jgi:S-DNA-T family DNA segregation ATPase FtsK/SpoIIIE
VVHNPDRPPLRLVPDDRDEPEFLPAVPGEAEVAEPIEGTVVAAETDVQPRATVRIRAVITDVAAHPRTRTAARHIAYVALGSAVAAKKIWDARTTAPYRRNMTTAMQTGDQDKALEWARLIEMSKRNKLEGQASRIEAVALLLGKFPKIAIGLFAGLIVLGVLLAIADKDPQQVSAPLVGFAHLVHFIAGIVGFAVVVFGIAWTPSLILAPVLGVLALWQVGRTRAVMPAWLATASEADVDMPIDETTIAQALGALRIPQITAYLKDGLKLQFITTCRKDGRGTHAVVRLPAGVTADRIARRRADLATGLYRRAQEVWPSTGSEAGIMDLWVADKGALAEGAGPYPLLDGGLVDVFKGVPFGRTLRGEPLLAPIVGRNTIVGGMPDQGKSSAARIVMLGCALDPTVEIRIYVPDANFDFEAFKPRCARYVMGAEDEQLERICLDLEQLVAEIQTRGELLIRFEQEQVTRELAARHIGLHPVVVLLEEAHLAFGHRQYGERIAEAAETIVRLGRKRAIHLIASTQATTGQSVPQGITINCANGVAFAVARWQENDALLGQGAYSAGHRATDLIPGTDKGNAVVKGFTGDRSTVAQAYYVSPSRGRDQVSPVIARAMAAIAKRGRGVPGSGSAPRPVEARDLLADLDEVLGAEQVRLKDLTARLRELAPHWTPYRDLTGEGLYRLLTAEQVRTVKSGNVRYLYPADLRAAIEAPGRD